MDTEQKLVIKFEGQSHQVDLNTLTSSLLELSRSLTEIQKREVPNATVKIKIDALASGSFEVHALVAAVNNSDMLMAASTILGVTGGAAGLIAGTYKSFVWLKSKIGGQKIEKVEKINDRETRIETNTGQVIVANNVVFNLYQNSQQLHDSVASQFRILSEDPAVEGISIDDKNNGSEPIKVESENFGNLAADYIASVQDRQRQVREHQNLSVVRAIFEESTTRRWEFIWEGTKIAANVEDIEFLKSVGTGAERFGKGDRLVADVAIWQRYDNVYDTWMNDTFHVTKVHSHETRSSPVQMKMM